MLVCRLVVCGVYWHSWLNLQNKRMAMRSPVKRRIIAKASIRGLTHLCSIKQSCLFIEKCKDLRLGTPQKEPLLFTNRSNDAKYSILARVCFRDNEEGVARVYKFVRHGINM